MAQTRPMKERTVAFYEIVAAKSGEQERVEQLPWEETLAALAKKRDVTERTFESDAVFVGNIATVHEEDHLLLHRVKSPGEWLSVLNWNTGEWRELESRASEGYLDTSVICFLPYGNVIGLMQGSASAPTHRSLQTWLNGLKLFPDMQLVARPLMSRAEVEKLRRASGASKIEIRIGSSKMSALADKSGRLASFLHRASLEYGDVDVTVIISVPRGKARDEDRELLLADLRDLEDVVPEAAERARARLVYAEERGPEYSRLVELVEHHITAKRRVAAVNEEGESIRILSGVDAILSAAAEHEEELRLAVDADA
jgi:hypothetical protein